MLLGMPISARRCAVAVLLLLLVSQSAAAGLHPSPSISAPIFLWGSKQYFAASTSYQVVHGLRDTLQRVVSSVLNPSTQEFLSDWLDQETLAQHQPEVLLLVLGSQVQSSDLHAMPKQLQPLQQLLQTARYSLSVPYVMHQLAGQEGAAQRLPLEVAGLAAAGMVVGCGGEQQSIGAALERLQGSEPGVIVLCTSVAADVAGTPEGVAAELQQVQDAHNAVAALNKRHLTVYALLPDAGRLQPQRRILQSANADVGTCGALCQTQVKWLEGILAALILALAAFSGMCCLYMLDTPTRFEKAKEGARND